MRFSSKDLFVSMECKTWFLYEIIARHWELLIARTFISPGKSGLAYLQIGRQNKLTVSGRSPLRPGKYPSFNSRQPSKMNAMDLWQLFFSREFALFHRRYRVTDTFFKEEVGTVIGNKTARNCTTLTHSKSPGTVIGNAILLQFDT